MSNKNLDRAYDDFRSLLEEYNLDTIKIEKTDSYFEAEVQVLKNVEECDSRSNAVWEIVNSLRKTYSLIGHAEFDEKRNIWEFKFRL